MVQRAAYSDCRRRTRRHQRIRDPCRGRAKLIRQTRDGAIRKRRPTSHTKRLISSRMDPGYSYMTDSAIPPKQCRRNLLRQSACGLVSGKRGEESQEEFTSSVGLRPRVGKTRRGVARGIYFVSRPAASFRENPAGKCRREYFVSCPVYQHVFPDRAVAPASNAPPFRSSPAHFTIYASSRTAR